MAATETAAIGTVEQARAQQTANALADKHFRLQRRPRIAVQDFSVKRGLSDGDPVEFALTIVNVGEGQAFRLRATRGSKTVVAGNAPNAGGRHPPALDDWPGGKNPPVEIPILSRETLKPFVLTVQGPHFPDPNTHRDYGYVGPKRIAVVGEVMYGDDAAPDQPYRTCFCLIWKPKFFEMMLPREIQGYIPPGSVPPDLPHEGSFLDMVQMSLPREATSADFEYCPEPNSNCLE